MSKLEVYLNEYNILMDRIVYLPLVSGLLQAYAETYKKIRESYKFMPIIFFRAGLEEIISLYKKPSVVAFSTSMWNMNLSLEVAKRIKKKFPESLIIFGGPEIPFSAAQFFLKHPFIDITVRGEGEKTFRNILSRFLITRNLEGIPGISYRNGNGQYIKNNKEVDLEKNLDNFPSPYLNGIFDEIIYHYPKIKFQAIVETNRGCPYLCAYCSWGQGGLSKQFRFFSLKRVRQIASWCGDKKIEYVFCADSNFGLFKRDLEITKYFINSKINHHGFPEKFRVCYAKNSEETVYKIGELLHLHDMEKGITLSRQSNNSKTLANIGRKNMKMSNYNILQKRYNQRGIPVYTELILGLPGESYKSFREGLESILESGIRNQIFIYPCQVYQNTTLADPKYQKKFKIVLKCIPLKELHAAIKSEDDVTEYETIIVSTSTMSKVDWKKSMVISWLMQLLYDLKLGFFLLNYLFDKYKIKHLNYLEYLIAHKNDVPKTIGKEILYFQQSTDLILNGSSYNADLLKFGRIYWGREEVSFFRLLQNKKEFYKEMNILSRKFLSKNVTSYNKQQLKEIIKYQMIMIPSLKKTRENNFIFSYNIPEYFEKYFSRKKLPLVKKPQVAILNNSMNYMNNKERFAKEVVLKGRKSNKLTNLIRWHDV